MRFLINAKSPAFGGSHRVLSFALFAAIRLTAADCPVSPFDVMVDLMKVKTVRLQHPIGRLALLSHPLWRVTCRILAPPANSDPLRCTY